MLHADARPVPVLETRRALNRSLLLHVIVLGLVLGLPYLHTPPKVVELPAIQAVLVAPPVVKRPEPVPAPPPVAEPALPPPPPVTEKIEFPAPVREPPKIVLPKAPEKPAPKVAEKPVAKKPPTPIISKAALKPLSAEDEMQALRQEVQQAEMRRELEATARVAKASLDTSQLSRYQQDIRNKVYQKANFPPGSEGRTVQVRISILPGGEVTNVIVVKTSGDANVDAIVRSAVLAASPLPVPEDPRLFNNFRSGIFAFTVQ